jgi:hypothetical protein
VVLPHPEGPRRHRVSPDWAENSTPLITGTPSKARRIECNPNDTINTQTTPKSNRDYLKEKKKRKVIILQIIFVKIDIKITILLMKLRLNIYLKDSHQKEL